MPCINSINRIGIGMWLFQKRKREKVGVQGSQSRHPPLEEQEKARGLRSFSKKDVEKLVEAILGKVKKAREEAFNDTYTTQLTVGRELYNIYSTYGGDALVQVAKALAQPLAEQNYLLVWNMPTDTEHNLKESLKKVELLAKLKQGLLPSYSSPFSEMPLAFSYELHSQGSRHSHLQETNNVGVEEKAKEEQMKEWERIYEFFGTVPIIMKNMLTVFGNFADKAYPFVVAFPLEGAEISAGINVLYDNRSLERLDATEKNYGRALLNDVSVSIIHGNRDKISSININNLYIYVSCRPIIHFYNEEGAPIIIGFKHDLSPPQIPAGVLKIPSDLDVRIAFAKNSLDAFMQILKGIFGNVEKGLLKNKKAEAANDVAKDLLRLLNISTLDNITFETIGHFMIGLEEDKQRTMVFLLRKFSEELPTLPLTKPPISLAEDNGWYVEKTGVYCKN